MQLIIGMKLASGSPLQALLTTLPQHGQLCWIGIRPERKKQMLALPEVHLKAGHGPAGDHFSGSAASKRQITIISEENIESIASFMHLKTVSPATLRRNLVTKGINLLALKDKQFYVGHILMEYTGECHPCSRMEENLGPGGYNAVRGHGGITARVLSSGIIKLGDVIRIV